MPATRWAIIFAALSTLACVQDRPPPLHRITVEVYSDLNPLPGAHVLLAGRFVGTTDALGMLRMVLSGTDGTTVPMSIQCPAGTRSPSGTLGLILRTIRAVDQAAAARGIVERVNCPPEDRTVAVVVRTNGWPGLPVFWQGGEIARTDMGGVAHMTFRVKPSSQINLAVATDSRPSLRPQNPVRPFVVGDTDTVFVWRQDFNDEDETSSTARGPRRAKPHAPQRTHRETPSTAPSPSSTRSRQEAPSAAPARPGLVPFSPRQVAYPTSPSDHATGDRLSATPSSVPGSAQVQVPMPSVSPATPNPSSPTGPTETPPPQPLLLPTHVPSQHFRAGQLRSLPSRDASVPAQQSPPGHTIPTEIPSDPMR